LSKRVVIVLLLGACLIACFSTSYFLANVVIFSSNNLLTNTNCNNPCWRGIQPGMSQMRDLTSLLDSDKFIRDYALQTDLHTEQEGRDITPNILSDAIRLNWSDWRTSGVSSALVKNNIVIQIQFNNYSQLALGNVIDAVGPPSHYVVYLTEYLVITRFVGYFPAKGLVIISDQPRADKLMLNPNLRVKDIYYFEPTTVDGMFAFWPYLATYANPKCTKENWKVWGGYVEVKVLPHELECAHRN